MGGVAHLNLGEPFVTSYPVTVGNRSGGPSPNRSFRLDPENLAWLRELALAQRRSVNFILNDLVSAARQPPPVLIPKAQAEMMARAVAAGARLGQVVWADPDDAPEWSDEVFERAEVRKGGKVVREATGTLTRPGLQIGPATRKPGSMLKGTKK